MAKIELSEIGPVERELMLSVMATSPAFALFCEHWEQSVIGKIDAEIFDTETSDAKTRELKLTRGQLTGTKHPRKVVETMIRAAHAEKQQQETKKG